MAEASKASSRYTSGRKANMFSPLGVLGNLPAELRLTIYEDVFANFTITTQDKIAACVGGHSFLPPLLNTSQVLRCEVIRAYRKRLDELQKSSQEATEVAWKAELEDRPRRYSLAFHFAFQVDSPEYTLAAARSDEMRVQLVRDEELKRMHSMGYLER